MVWWSWTNPQPNPNEQDVVVMEGLTEEEMHDWEFAQLVQRCLMMDNLSFTITHAILCAALGQFGTVQSIKLLRDPKNPGKCIGTAIVEMETAQQADVIVKQMQEFMFMVGGMPRPARAYKATEAMFIDHPLRCRKSLELRFLKRGEPGAREAFQKREIAERHAFERNYIQQQQRIAEEELAMKQFENFQELRKKYESIKDNKEIDMLRQLYKLPDRVR
jgi:RNA recognition motif-containing protein